MPWPKKKKSDKSSKETQKSDVSKTDTTDQKDSGKPPKNLFPTYLQGIALTAFNHPTAGKEEQSSSAVQFTWKCACGQDIAGDPFAHRCAGQEEPSGLDYIKSLGVDGCFSGESMARLAGGECKRVKDLKKGDHVECNARGDMAEVRCVLVQHTTDGRTEMVEFEDGLALTPMHPVEFDSAWALPKDLGDVRLVRTGRVFNFVLDKHHTIRLNGVTCAVLGHRRSGLTSHPFWGSWERVNECMRRVDAGGFEVGLVEVSGTVRDHNGTVYGLKDMNGNPAI